jgi:hypothetical protein
MIITSPTGRIPAGPNLQGIPIRTPEVQAIREAMTDPLFDYQIKGATFLASSRRALLADEPRVGKTAAAIRACDLVNANAILWVTTGSARWDHAAAWARFSQKKRAIRPGSLTISATTSTLTITYTAPDGGGTQSASIAVGGSPAVFTPATTTITLAGKTGAGSDKVRAED